MPTAEAKEIIWPFGKHRGTPTSKLSLDYCDWALKNLDNLSQELRDALEMRLNGGVQEEFFKKPMGTVPSTQLCADILSLGLLQKTQISKSEEETKLIQEAGRYMRNQLHLPLL